MPPPSLASGPVGALEIAAPVFFSMLGSASAMASLAQLTIWPKASRALSQRWVSALISATRR